jgi:hypothetical protein
MPLRSAEIGPSRLRVAPRAARTPPGLTAHPRSGHCHKPADGFHDTILGQAHPPAYTLRLGRPQSVPSLPACGSRAGPGRAGRGGMAFPQYVRVGGFAVEALRGLGLPWRRRSGSEACQWDLALRASLAPGFGQPCWQRACLQALLPRVLGRRRGGPSSPPPRWGHWEVSRDSRRRRRRGRACRRAGRGPARIPASSRRARPARTRR